MEHFQPKLRFAIGTCKDPCFKTICFEELFNFSTGKNIKQSEASPVFETPCVRYGELYHMYNEVIYQVVNRTNLDKSELSFSLGNEILLPSAGEDPLDIGSASALTVKDVAIGRTINILRPKQENLYSHIYVSYYINQCLKPKIASLAKGVSISNVYNSDLKTLEINLPCLEEQQKIASFLSTIDEKIQLLKKQQALLEKYKKVIIKMIFSCELRFKDENGKDFPQWRDAKLQEVVTKQSSNISANKIELNFGEYILYGAAGVLKKIDFYEIESDYISVVKDGAGVGRLLYCKGKSSVLGTLEILKPIASQIDTRFAYYLLSTIDFSKYVTGSTIPHIYFRDYQKEKVLIPVNKEQQKIASFLTAIDEKIDNCKEEIRLTEEWKKGLLQQMFV